MKKYLRILIAGIAFPSILLPILLLKAWAFGKPEIFNIKFLHFLPLIWGIWNVLYFAWFLTFLPRNRILGLLMTGGMLGFFIALIGVFALNIPMVIGLPEAYRYLPLLLGPLIYAIAWLCIVYPLNRLVGVYSDKLPASAEQS